MGNNDKEPFNPFDRKVILFAVLSFVVLVLMVILNYSPPDEKVFGLGSYYVGNRDNEPDYAALYNKLYSTSINENACSTMMKKAENRTLLNNVTWIVDGQQVTADVIKSFSVGDDTSTIKPYTSTSNLIVAPVGLEFLNSNISTVSTKGDGICIEAAVGTEYVIEWKGIESWWCHIDKPDPDKHTQVCGRGGGYYKCNEGFIIGKATSETKVSLYKVDADGNRTPCSFLELYRVEDSNSAETD